MDLWSFGIFFIGMALGGLVSLAIFSMLAMAHKEEKDLNRLEIEPRK